MRAAADGATYGGLARESRHEFGEGGGCHVDGGERSALQTTREAEEGDRPAPQLPRCSCRGGTAGERPLRRRRRQSLMRVMRRAAGDVSLATPRQVRGKACSKDREMQPGGRGAAAMLCERGKEGGGGGVRLLQLLIIELIYGMGAVPLPQPRSTKVKAASPDCDDGGRACARCSARSTRTSVSGRGIRTSGVTKNSWSWKWRERVMYGTGVPLQRRATKRLNDAA